MQKIKATVFRKKQKSIFLFTLFHKQTFSLGYATSDPACLPALLLYFANYDAYFYTINGNTRRFESLSVGR